VIARTLPAQLFALCALSGACRAPGELSARRPNAFFPDPPDPAPAAAAPGIRELPAVVARVRLSVVSVVAGRTALPPAPAAEHAGQAREHALGSGFLIAPDGLVLTARHVIDGADDVRVDLDDGRSFHGAVVARDAALDVALIHLDHARGLPVATLGSSGALRVGDPVMAIGNPFGLGPSVTVGILSATARPVEDGPEGIFLQTDAAVNPGDSGGPLLDARGQVVGVNTAILAHGHGIAFAVPIDDIRAVLGELQTTGRVLRGHLGLTIQTVDAALARALGLPGPTGALVSAVEGSGPAQRAGVRPGDLITEEDGHPIARAEDLSHDFGKRKPGEVIRFTLRRAEGVRTASLVLDRLPNPDGDAEARGPRPPRSHGVTGLHLADVIGGGARVDGIDPGSAAAEALHLGDVVVEVDHTAVQTAADAARRLAQAPRTLLIRVRRDGSFLYIGIDLDRT
jgi:serine protease Do